MPIKTITNHKNGCLDHITKITTRPTLKYIGFALLLAWHYALWFVPGVFIQTELLDECITVSWLVNLGATVISLLFIAFTLGRNRHLSSHYSLYITAPMLTSLINLAICLIPQVFTAPIFAYVLSFFLGITESVMWILWGERYACVKANFTLRHIGMVFGLTLLVTVSLAWILPPYIMTIFVALLPIISGLLLIVARRDGAQLFPTLLPQNTAQGDFKNMVLVSAITFLASIACYFLVAIIPWEVLPAGEYSFTLGIIGGAVICLIMSGISIASKDKANIFKMLPWFLVILIAAFAMFLADEAIFFPAFIIAAGVSSLLEILLIMYFGILTSKGYVPPAIAFAFSGAFVRAGIGIGNLWALDYEHMPNIAFNITPETSLGLMCILAALLVPLVRREFHLIALTVTPPAKAEIDEICFEVSKEFNLSGSRRKLWCNNFF